MSCRQTKRLARGCLGGRTRRRTRLPTRAGRQDRAALPGGGMCSHDHLLRWTRLQSGRRRLSRRSGPWRSNDVRGWPRAARCRRSAAAMRLIELRPACQACPHTYRTLRRAAPPPWGRRASPTRPRGSSSVESEQLTIGTLVRATEEVTLLPLSKLDSAPEGNPRRLRRPTVCRHRRRRRTVRATSVTPGHDIRAVASLQHRHAARTTTAGTWP